MVLRSVSVLALILIYGVPVNNVATVPVVITACRTLVPVTGRTVSATLTIFNRRPAPIADVMASINFVRYDRRSQTNVNVGRSYALEAKRLDGYEVRTLKANILRTQATGMRCRLLTLTTNQGHLYTFAPDSPVSTADHL